MGEQFPGTWASGKVPGVATFPIPATENLPKCSKISLREHFLMPKMLPQKMHFLHPSTYQASTLPARGYLTTNLPTHSLRQLIPPCTHGLVHTRTTCCCHCPSSKWGCSCHWSCSIPTEQVPHLQPTPLSQVTPLANLQQTQTLTLHWLCSRQAYPAQHTLALWLRG